MNKIKIGIVGYGNLGKGVEAAIGQNADTELVAVFTRRNPESIKTLTNVTVDSIENILSYKGKIDVMIICGGSATDLPVQVPEIAKNFNTIDSFDTHAKIPEFFESVNRVNVANGTVSIISVGWDPGLFSVNRVLSEAILPVGNTYTFWGEGVSQGHSDAIRRIEGVVDAKQYTVPVEDAIDAVRNGDNPELSTREKHTRVCYVVVEDSADKNRIEKEIKEMPNYFSDYFTTVHFISQDELNKNHSGMPHGGFVIRSGESGLKDKQLIEFSLKLESNPSFTSSVLVSYARAAVKFAANKQFGAKSVLDVPPAYISSLTNDELRKSFL